MLTARGRDVKDYVCLSTDNKPANAAKGLSIAVTGDITEDHGYCTITGNGTITIS